jgi:hypothetical protein
MKRSLLSLLTVAVFLTGCAERTVYVQSPPPAVPAPPPEAVVVTPGPAYVWVPGYWSWNGSWVWVAGHYVVPPHPRAVWVGPHWGHGPHGYVWIRGYWR